MRRRFDGSAQPDLELVLALLGDGVALPIGSAARL
jgi:hypothetical protein